MRFRHLGLKFGIRAVAADSGGGAVRNKGAISEGSSPSVALLLLLILLLLMLLFSFLFLLLLEPTPCATPLAGSGDGGDCGKGAVKEGPSSIVALPAVSVSQLVLAVLVATMLVPSSRLFLLLLLLLLVIPMHVVCVFMQDITTSMH